MSSAQKTLKQLKSVWSDAGLKEAPQAEDVKDNVQRVRKKSLRSPKHGGVMVSVRVTREEKRKLETIAFRDDISLGEVLSQMLALYEEKHGRVLGPEGTG